jgi:dUTP pyrophosphatase
MSTTLKVRKTHPDATLPTRAKPGDSGLDLHAVLDTPVVIRAGDRHKFDCGIAIELPEGHEAQVRPRSGLALKSGVQAAFGTIDNGYRGPIGVTLFNLSFRDHTVRHGDRIAQLVVAPVAYPEVVEVDELTPTERGSGGFGSTGV